MWAASEIKKRILEKVPEYTSKWTDFGEADLGVVLVSMVADALDKFLYFLDLQKDEFYISTVKERRNAVNLLQLVGYVMGFPRSSIATLSVSSVDEVSLTIPSLTEFKSSSGQSFYVKDERSITMSCGAPATLEVYEGVLRQFTITAADSIKDYLYVLPCIPSQDFVLLKDLSGFWTRIDTSDIFEGVKKEFRLVYTSDGIPAIEFPPSYASILEVEEGLPLSIYVLVSSEENGQIAAKTISGTLDAVLSQDDYPGLVLSNISFINSNASVGGRGWETIEEARQNLIPFLRSQGRAVTIPDFDWIVGNQAYIKTHTVYDINSDPTLSLYEVKIVAEPESGLTFEFISEQLKAYLMPRTMIGTKITIVEPVHLLLDLTVEIKANVSTESALTSLVSEIKTFIMAYFADFKIGKSYSHSHLAGALLREFDEIEDLNITPTSETVNIDELCILSSLNVTATSTRVFI